MPAPLREALFDASEEERGRIERIWDVLGRHQPPGEIEPSIDDAWSDLNVRLQASKRRRRSIPGAPDRRSRRRRVLRTGIAGAATCAVLLVAWFLVDPVTITVEPGTQREITLPDGSTVHINSATDLRYARYFHLVRIVPVNRWVHLDGEAFFEVASNGSGFIVSTSEARIEVLGTEFNVRSRPGFRDGGTEVVLASGRVRVTSASNPDRTMVLSEPGTSGTVLEAGDIRTWSSDDAVSLEHALAWRQHGFAAVDRPLGSILDEVERRFGVTIAPRDGIDPAELMSLFYLRGGTADQILRDVCLAQECTYRETSRGYALESRNPSF